MTTPHQYQVVTLCAGAVLRQDTHELHVVR